MILKDRQISGIPLEKGPSFIVALLMVPVVMFLAYKFWFPILGIPEELQKWIVTFGCVLQLVRGVGNVPTGKERAQKFFGSYTGVSFPPGVYLLPRLPIPILSLFMELIFPEEVSKYLAGWLLEDEINVQDITFDVDVTGLTSDGHRVEMKSVLVFRIVNAGVFLYQTKINTDSNSLKDSVQAQTISSLKNKVIPLHSAKDLYQANFATDSMTIANWISEACDFVKDYGLVLVNMLHVDVNMLSKRMEKAFDADSGKELLRSNTNEVAESYKEFKRRLPENTSEEAAFMLFNLGRIDDDLPTVDMSILKLK